MTRFELPDDLMFNVGRVGDPVAYARERKPAAWLLLTGAEFAADGGVSFDHVKGTGVVSANVISDPPRILNLDLARKHVEVLDELPRPTLITCRMGPRSSAVAYMYAGLRANAAPADVIAAAKDAGAPFAGNAELEAWVVDAMTTLAK